MASTYSFESVHASLVGPTGVINLGYGAAVAAEGITISMAGEKNKMTMGADGRGMHSLMADKSAVVTVRLLQTSPINAQLMVAYDAQTINPALHGQNTIVITQKQSGDVTTCQQCAFKKKPDVNYKQEGQTYEWTFDSIITDTILGTY